MLKRLFSIGLVVLLFHAGNSLLIHDALANQSKAASDKVKTAVAKTRHWTTREGHSKTERSDQAQGLHQQRRRQFLHFV